MWRLNTGEYQRLQVRTGAHGHPAVCGYMGVIRAAGARLGNQAGGLRIDAPPLWTTWATMAPAHARGVDGEHGEGREKDDATVGEAEEGCCAETREQTTQLRQAQLN